MKKRICVIGAGGMSGISFLNAFNTLSINGQSILALEQSSILGGTWRLEPTPHRDASPRSTAELLSPVVHSSMYESLVTNLPKHVMQYSDFPYEEAVPSFPNHKQVLEYMQAYVHKRALGKHIQFNAKVEKVSRIGNAWNVEYTHDKLRLSQEVDALVICNGVSGPQNSQILTFPQAFYSSVHP
jgi:cation diffusion facilitator CzcD-associated flavoprotein CzcO